jgi:hypothetical protein
MGSVLKDGVEAPDLEGYRSAAPRQIVDRALAADIERYVLPDHVREDYLSSYEGDRFVESMRYVRSYPTELPILRDLLPIDPEVSPGDELGAMVEMRAEGKLPLFVSIDLSEITFT